jgi:hypothetical protein
MPVRHGRFHWTSKFADNDVFGGFVDDFYYVYQSLIKVHLHAHHYFYIIDQLALGLLQVHLIRDSFCMRTVFVIFREINIQFFPTTNLVISMILRILQIVNWQFIGQDLAALELCFENQKDFSDYTTKHFNWEYAMCHLYIVYHRFIQCLYILEQFATNVQSSVVGWTVTKQKLCPQLIIHQAHFGNELCCHIVKPLTLTTTRLPRQVD